MPRVFLTVPLHVGESVVIGGEEGHHFARVLRIRVSEEVALVTSGQAYLGTITEVDNKNGEVVASVVSTLPSTESRHNVYLVQGLAKGDKIDTIIQKCTEVGVRGVLVVETNRSIVKLPHDKRPSKVARWQKICQEAASQSQRDVVPEISFAKNEPEVQQWLESLGDTQIYFADEDESALGLKDAIKVSRSQSSPTATSVIVVGPEGGWDDAERTWWKSTVGASIVTLGRRILRTETAGIVAISAVLYEYGELGGGDEP